MRLRWNRGLRVLRLCAGVIAAMLAAAPAQAVTEIQWWHAMSGELKPIVEQLASDFNASQNDYRILPDYKGQYTQTMTAALLPQARTEALCLYQALQHAKAIIKAGIVDTDDIREKMTDRIHTVCPSSQIDYIAFNDSKTLESIAYLRSGTVCSLAVRLHGIRLIDNMRLK